MTELEKIDLHLRFIKHFKKTGHLFLQHTLSSLEEDLLILKSQIQRQQPR